MSDIRPTLAKLADGARLNVDEAQAAFDIIMAGAADLAQMSAFVTALRVRGETVDEIVGGAKAMRARAESIAAPIGSVDTCGTGGSGIEKYNISTAAAFVTVAAGVPVAKHGNRAASSKSGSADVLEGLGANLEASMDHVQKAIEQTGFTFLYARSHHKAMRHVAPVRSSIRFKTIFNLLGPLSNPARAKRQVLGVFDRKWLRPMAEVLKALGSDHVWVVHGSDGMDEVTTTGTTYVAELRDGHIEEFEVSPLDAGLPVARLEDLRGGDVDENTAALRRVMAGEKSAYRDIVLMNTAAALIVGGKVETLGEGVALAAKMIDDGKAAEKLEEWVAFTNHYEPEATYD